MRLRNLSLTSLALAVCSVSAFATPVPIVTTASYTGVLLATSSGSGTAPTGPGVTKPFSVNFTESVYRGGTGALCPTCINFVYSFSDTAPAGYNPIESLVSSSFLGFNVATGYVVGTGVAPVDTTQNATGNVTFTFSGANVVNPGQSSDTVVIFTNALNYDAGTISFQDGTTYNGIGLGFEPSSAAPEPSSLALLGTGILGVAGAARRRFKK